MKHFSLFSGLFLGLMFTAFSQTTYTWIGGASGTMATAGNWSPSRTAAATDILIINTSANITVSTVTIGQLQITNNATVTLTPSANTTISISGGTGDDLTIASGSKLILGTNSTFFCRLQYSSPASNIKTAQIAGTLEVLSIGDAVVLTSNNSYNGTNGTTTLTGRIISRARYQVGTIPSTSNPSLIVANGGVFEHAYSGQTTGYDLPFATWQTGSTCLVSGQGITSATTLGNAAQTFSKFVWDCPSQTGFTVEVGAITGVADSFIVKSSGAGGSVSFARTANSSVSIANFKQTGGIVSLCGAGAVNATLTVTGSFEKTGGTLQWSATGATGAPTLKVAGNFSQTGGTITNPGGVSTAILECNGTAGAQAVAFGTTTGTFGIINSNTTSGGVAITGNYPANSPLTLAVNSQFLSVTGDATFGTITNNTTDPVIAFNGTSVDQTINTTGALPSGLSLRVSNPQGVLFDNVGAGITIPANGTLYLKDNAFTVGIAGYNTTGTRLVYEGTIANTASSDELPATGLPAEVVLANTGGISIPLSRTFAKLTLTSGAHTTDQDHLTTDLVLNGGSLTLTGGKTLSVGTSTATPGTVTGNTGHIIGHLKRWMPASTGTYEFSIGTAQPIIIEFTGAPATGGTITATFTAGDPGSVNVLPFTTTGGFTVESVAANGYWTVEPADGLSGGTYSITVDPSSFGFSDFSQTRLLKRPNAASAWSDGGGTLVAPGTANALTITGLTSFSEFGVGGGGGAFPIELMEFSAYERGAANQLEWSTATETNVSFFEILRSETGTGSWVSLSEMPAAGNSQTTQAYAFTDLSPAPVSYYRLRTVDADGTFSFSHIQSVVRAGEKTTVSMMPVPVTNTLTVRIAGTYEGIIRIRLMSLSGAQLLFHEQPLETGAKDISLDLNSLPSGVYMVSVSGSVSHQQLIVKE